jgi:hypothetical protein
MKKMPFRTLFYDDREAVKFIAERTGQDVETVERFLEARTQYQKMMGQFGSAEREALCEERSLYADLLPAGDGEYLSLVTEYVRRTTGLPAERIADMLAEETAYMVETKIMDADAYRDFRAWADEYKQGNASAA